MTGDIVEASFFVSYDFCDPKGIRIEIDQKNKEHKIKITYDQIKQKGDYNYDSSNIIQLRNLAKQLEFLFPSNTDPNWIDGKVIFATFVQSLILKIK